MEDGGAIGLGDVAAALVVRGSQLSSSPPNFVSGPYLVPTQRSRKSMTSSVVVRLVPLLMQIEHTSQIRIPDTVEG